VRFLTEHRSAVPAPTEWPLIEGGLIPGMVPSIHDIMEQSSTLHHTVGQVMDGAHL
jgi:hypothetical protein